MSFFPSDEHSYLKTKAKQNHNSCPLRTKVGMIVDKIKRDINIKNLLKNKMSLWSYCCFCAELADLASRHNNSRRFFPSLPHHFSIVQTIVCFIIAIYAQKSTATDRYWWSFGPAKFDAATAGFEAETRRAISSSISVLFLHIMHINISHNIMYNNILSERWYNIIIMSITTKNTQKWQYPELNFSKPRLHQHKGSGVDFCNKKRSWCHISAIQLRWPHK